MCLAVPGKLEVITSDDDLMPMGKVRFGGVSREVCLACVPEVEVGDYVLVHVGMAISVVDEGGARRVFQLLEEVDPEALAEVTDSPADGDSADRKTQGRSGDRS